MQLNRAHCRHQGGQGVLLLAHHLCRASQQVASVSSAIRTHPTLVGSGASPATNSSSSRCRDLDSIVIELFSLSHLFDSLLLNYTYQHIAIAYFFGVWIKL